MYLWSIARRVNQDQQKVLNFSEDRCNSRGLVLIQTALELHLICQILSSF